MKLPSLQRPPLAASDNEPLLTTLRPEQRPPFYWNRFQHLEECRRRHGNLSSDPWWRHYDTGHHHLYARVGRSCTSSSIKLQTDCKPQTV